MSRAGRGRGTIERERVAAIEDEGFIPWPAWRDVEARIAQLEHSTRVRILLGLPLIRRIVRLPAWAR